MKLVHISDLHIGKSVNGYSMLEDQKHILNQVLNIIENEHPGAVLIAGDVYDKSVPSAEAVETFDDFLYGLARKGTHVFMISGNHDSPERLCFGSRIMNAQGIHISPVFGGMVKPDVLEDEHGPVNFYMLPFIKPANVRRFVDNTDILTYTDAVGAAVKAMNIDPSERNVLITHQFVTGAIRSESEEISVGGTDNVDACVFEEFDYTALGHIHRPQNITGKIRYSGSPLKYSFSESKYDKSVTLAELGKKGNLSVRTIPLKPLHEMVELKGKYEDIIKKSFYEDTSWQEDYVHITLTDEEDVLNAAARLRTVYHNLMKLDYDNARTRQDAEIETPADMEGKSPLELFEEFYALQNALPLSDIQKSFVRELIEKIWEDEI